MSKPDLAIIAAMDRHRLIGASGHLPWHCPADLRLFRQLTEGHTVIMGRKTFESLKTPLENRHNLVLSRTLPDRPGVTVCRSLAEALATAWRIGEPVFIIGGSTLYAKAMQIATTLHISWIDGEYSGDRYFPEIDTAAWTQVEERRYDGFRYVRYVR